MNKNLKLSSTDTSIKKFVNLYYIYQTFFNLLLIIPIFYEVQKIAGISDKSIYNIQSIYYIAFILLEIPSGFFADICGRKKSLIISAMLLLFSNFLPIFIRNELGFLLHFLIIAVARSLNSGTASAILYNFLNQKNCQADFKKIEGNARSYALIGRFIAWPMTGYLLVYNFNLPFIITAVFISISLGSILLLKVEEEDQKDQNSDLKNTNNIFESFQLIKNNLRKNPLLILIMVQGTGFFVLQRIGLLQLAQPLLKSKDFSVESFGILLSVATMFEALAAKNSYRIKTLIKDDKKSVFILTIFLAFIFVTLGNTNKVATVPILFIFSFFCGLIFPIQKQLLNDNINLEKFRATLISIESIIQRIVAALITFIIGVILDKNDVSLLFNGIGVAIILVITINYVLLIKINRTNMESI